MLNVAASKGDLVTMKCLVELGANPNVEDEVVTVAHVVTPNYQL